MLFEEVAEQGFAVSRDVASPIQILAILEKFGEVGFDRTEGEIPRARDLFEGFSLLDQLQGGRVGCAPLGMAGIGRWRAG